MKLVEPEFDIEADADDVEHPTPPRPERRRVYVSAFVTLAVLVAATNSLACAG